MTYVPLVQIHDFYAVLPKAPNLEGSVQRRHTPVQSRTSSPARAAYSSWVSSHFAVESVEYVYEACSHFLRACVRSFGKAALLALPFRVFGGCVASNGLGSPCSGARPSLPGLGF